MPARFVAPEAEITGLKIEIYPSSIGEAFADIDLGRNGRLTFTDPADARALAAAITEAADKLEAAIAGAGK